MLEVLIVEWLISSLGGHIQKPLLKNYIKWIPSSVTGCISINVQTVSALW